MSSAVLVEAKRLPSEGSLRLTWEDGHVGEYPVSYLRGWCPCAMCQGHTGLGITFHPAAGPVTLESVLAVGNYALTLGFSDRHGTGIYRFDFLRDICPCPSCGGPASGTR
jgi:DUF971 family protein